MHLFGPKSACTVAAAIVSILVTPGCATKKYVAKQVAPVTQRVDTLETQTNQKFGATDEKIAALSTKHEQDISQISERISSTDLKVTQAAQATQQAQSAASDAMKEAQSNNARIDSTSASVNSLASGVNKAMNYDLVEKADVTFDFDKAALSDEAKAALDQLASKVQSITRVQVEVVGFTDQTGSPDYNLELSQKRAEAVQRYLVMKKVPLRSMTVIGLGEEAPPPGLEADVQAVDPNASQADMKRLARRVRVSVFQGGEVSATRATASRAQE